jgi:hypothetical protein
MADQSEKIRELLRRRADAYRTLVQTPGWADCLQEMLAYADRAQDAAVRCGRLDMIAHMIRAADTAGNILTEAPTNGT